MDARDIVSNNIRYYRLEKKWTQEELAEKLGTTATYVSRLENAKKNIRVDYINHIANTLNITPKELFIERPLIKNVKRKRKCSKKEGSIYEKENNDTNINSTNNHNNY